jgi:hypothetical protein
MSIIEGAFMTIIIATLALAMGVQAAPTATQAPSPVAPAPAPDYKVGVSRLSDVIAKLGKPNTVTTISDGSIVAAFVSTRTRVKGASFVPIVGMFAGGAKSKISVKVFTFGADGLLKSFTSTDSGTNCSVGIQGSNCS